MTKRDSRRIRKERRQGLKTTKNNEKETRKE